MSLVSPLSLRDRALVAAVFGTALSDMDRMAFALAAEGDLAFWGGKTLKTWSGRRYVFNSSGELCRVQEDYDGKIWLTVSRADGSTSED